MESLYLVMAVTDRERDEQFISLFQENNVSVLHVALGEGTAPSEILDYLYLNPSQKAVIFGVVTGTGLPQLLRGFKRKLFIDIPGNGIVTAVPLNSIGGKRSLEYLMEGQAMNLSEETEKEKEVPMAIHTEYELIFVIANEGYTDKIMDAAREAGAGGGTVIKARGTGGEHSQKFFGFSIADEKEIHMIVTPAQGRNHIMKSIMDQAGLDSKAQSIVFSLPVSHAIGLRMPDRD
ncbi:MAG: P-II family nitrogen regulator [Firmicutes bacterium]|nr:P-II family nitrogen regulator [Bacillota bacterium]